MSAPVLVTGGTGGLGGHVVPLLLAAGHRVRILSREPRQDQTGVTNAVGDLDSGKGVSDAVAGVELVVHLAGAAKGDDVKARALVEAARGAGVRHLVYISVVGAERVPVTSAVDRAMFGYFASKRSAEEIVVHSGLPCTTLRATQFHTLVFDTVRAMCRLPVVPVPAGLRFQPVDPAVVAARLVELALGPPAGLVPDVGGPEVLALSELTRSYLRATGRRRPLLPVRAPGGAAKALRAGANLTTPAGDTLGGTWADFLAARLTADSGSPGGPG